MVQKFKSTRGMPWWISNFFFVAGLLMLAGAWWITRDTVELLENGVSASGVVVELEASTDSDGDTTYSPVVKVTSREHGTYLFYSSTGSSPPSFSVGEEVEVIVDPKDKERAVINSFGQKWLGSIILSVMGGIFSVVGLFALGFLKHTEKRSRGGTDI